MTPPSAMTSFIIQPGKLQPLPSLQIFKKKITSWSISWNMSLNPDKSQSRDNLRKDRLENPPIYFLNNPFENVQSFTDLGLTISHDLSWANCISKWPPKPVTDWVSSILQSLSLTHLNSVASTRPLSAA